MILGSGEGAREDTAGAEAVTAEEKNRNMVVDQSSVLASAHAASLVTEAPQTDGEYC